MLKKSASNVLASFRPSTYPRGYASVPHSLRPCWTAFLSILLEVNLEREATKAGFLLDKRNGAMLSLGALPHVAVKGLMAIPLPNQRSGTGWSLLPSSAWVGAAPLTPIDRYRLFKGLSMGMSNDYHVAVEEGATMVGGGTAIFGARHA
jgi:uncharacterized pyridoxal phosphate-containing UPF0001 family protein